ncbi:hypothetical protein CES87_12135 [Pseudomonas sp. ERMR1:02]|nr:hypothetical protein [Pseudomonas sp. PCH199]PAM83688.1 hypothetical protein CES87_12135 [Pseudomonas sp. ERMR1:02]
MNTPNLPTDTTPLHDLLPANKEHILTNVDDAVLSAMIPIKNEITTLWDESHTVFKVMAKTYTAIGGGVGVTISTAPREAELSVENEASSTVVTIKSAVQTMNFNDMISTGHGNQKILRKLFTPTPDSNVWKCEVQAQSGEPYHFLTLLNYKEMILSARYEDHMPGGTVLRRTFVQTPDGSFGVSFKVGNHTHSIEDGISKVEVDKSAEANDIFIIRGTTNILKQKYINIYPNNHSIISLLFLPPT